MTTALITKNKWKSTTYIYFTWRVLIKREASPATLTTKKCNSNLKNISILITDSYDFSTKFLNITIIRRDNLQCSKIQPSARNFSKTTNRNVKNTNTGPHRLTIWSIELACHLPAAKQSKDDIEPTLFSGEETNKKLPHFFMSWFIDGTFEM